jgi:hypothetical protein
MKEHLTAGDGGETSLDVKICEIFIVSPENKFFHSWQVFSEFFIDF